MKITIILIILLILIAGCSQFPYSNKDNRTGNETRDFSIVRDSNIHCFSDGITTICEFENYVFINGTPTK